MAIGLLCGIMFSVEARKCVGRNVFYISPVINDSYYYFSLSDIETLQSGTHESLTVSYEIIKSERVELNHYEVNTKLIITNSEYFTLNHIQFTDGGVWPLEMEKERIAVISEALAWKLFGNVNVSGEYIRLSGKEYYVSGITKQDDYMPDNYLIWTPASPDIDRKEPVISKIYISLDVYSPLNSYLSVISNVTQLNKSARDYRIADMNRYIHSFELRYRLLAFVIGAWFACAIIYKIAYLLKKCLLNTTVWTPLIIIALLNIITVIIVIYSIRFDFWIPKFSSGTLTGICQTFFNSGLLPAEEYLSGGLLKLYQINTYANIAFVIGLFGLLNTTFLNKGGLHVEERNITC